MINTILSFIIIGILIFQFLIIMNVIKKIINNISENMHEFAKAEIYRILNDKELFDSLKDYAQGIAQGVLSKQTRGSGNIMQNLMGIVLSRFLPGIPGPGNTGQEDQGSKEALGPSNKRNPFTK